MDKRINANRTNSKYKDAYTKQHKYSNNEYSSNALHNKGGRGATVVARNVTTMKARGSVRAAIPYSKSVEAHAPRVGN